MLVFEALPEYLRGLPSGLFGRIWSMKKALICLALFLLAVQIPSFSQSLSKRDGQFTQEELVLDDKFISLNVDHFNTSLLLMLSYYYPGQFIFIDNEVKDLVDEYVNGKE